MNENNRLRLKMLLDIFQISVADAARTIGVSRPLLSRIVSGDPRVKGDIVWGLLEKRLGVLIEKRQMAYFSVKSTPQSIIDVAMVTIRETV